MQRCIISLSRSARRKVKAIAPVLLAFGTGVRLLLLLLVFLGLSSGRYPSPRADQGIQGDGRSLCGLKQHCFAEGQAYENRR